ncbi:hypothetical protein CspHIS471_0105610 [Cutaneotrichosporon sp. HIS471]|nr:hypothetical protein CspHIS471_0105610 [Cutaneotrichosporon sp. HIS471]
MDPTQQSPVDDKSDKPTNLRAKRSRKDRPCDHCRVSKRSCHIAVRGEACEHCARAGRECSFRAPPLNRHRKSSTTPTSTTNGYGPTSTEAGTSSLASRFGSTTGLSSGPSKSPSSWMGERSTLSLSRPHPGGGVRAFLDTLDERVAQQEEEDTFGYSSLDADVTEEEESHYLGSGAVAQLASVSLDSRLENGAADLPYRQVADPRNPAFFLKNPSRVYGHSNAAFVAEKAYQDVLAIINGVDPTLPDRLIQHFMTRTLPALPILNRQRFEACVQGWQGAGTFPYALLIGIFSHAAVHELALRPHSKQLWSICCHVIDNEYRQARLQTLQLEIICLAGRPILNPGGNHVGICRSLGVLQLLGLHRDCSRWKLPKWERALRKRLWWSLYVMDKWNAYTYGRPVNIEATRSSIPTLSFEDGDVGGATTPKESEIAVFVAMCRLSSVLEGLLPLVLDRDTYPRRLNLDRSLLRHGASDLETLYRDLPDDLLFDPTQPSPRPGSRSLQLSHLGVELLICRLGLEREEFEYPHHLIAANKQMLIVIEHMAVFIESLRPEDFDVFWAPWSAYQLTNAVTLLLQQAIRVHTCANVVQSGGPVPANVLPAIRDAAIDTSLAETITLLQRVLTAVQSVSTQWEVAGSAMPRVNSLIKSMPAIPGIDGVQSLLLPDPPAFGTVPDMEPDVDILALFDWLTGDISSGLQGGAGGVC